MVNKRCDWIDVRDRNLGIPGEDRRQGRNVVVDPLATGFFEERIDGLGQLGPALHLGKQPISQYTMRNEVDDVDDRLFVRREYLRDAQE